MKSVTAKWANENKESINIIDVRSSMEFKNKHIEGSKNIPTPGIILNADRFLDKNKEYYLICNSGGRSSVAYTQLEKLGYKVINIQGGIYALDK